MHIIMKIRVPNKGFPWHLGQNSKVLKIPKSAEIMGGGGLRAPPKSAYDLF